MRSIAKHDTTLKNPKCHAVSAAYVNCKRTHVVMVRLSCVRFETQNIDFTSDDDEGQPLVYDRVACMTLDTTHMCENMEIWCYHCRHGNFHTSRDNIHHQMRPHTQWYTYTCGSHRQLRRQLIRATESMRTKWWFSNVVHVNFIVPFHRLYGSRRTCLTSRLICKRWWMILVETIMLRGRIMRK